MTRADGHIGDQNLPYKRWFRTLDDPGNGETITANYHAAIAMTGAASTAETRTLSDPDFLGQMMLFSIASLGSGGTIAVTSSNDLGLTHSTGSIDKTATFQYDGDHLALIACYVQGELVWRCFHVESGQASLS